MHRQNLPVVDRRGADERPHSEAALLELWEKTEVCKLRGLSWLHMPMLLSSVRSLAKPTTAMVPASAREGTARAVKVDADGVPGPGLPPAPFGNGWFPLSALPSLPFCRLREGAEGLPALECPQELAADWNPCPQHSAPPEASSSSSSGAPAAPWLSTSASSMRPLDPQWQAGSPCLARLLHSPKAGDPGR